MSYILFFIYFIAAFTCAIYSLKPPVYDNINDIMIHRLMWISIASIMLLLGLNSQFPFIELLTGFGRSEIISHNLYNSHAIIQNWLAVTILCAILIIFISLKTFLKQAWLYNRLPLSCFIMILIFILIRALSLHEIDSLLKFNLYDLSLGSLMELFATSALILALVIQLRSNSSEIFKYQIDKPSRFI